MRHNWYKYPNGVQKMLTTITNGTQHMVVVTGFGGY